MLRPALALAPAVALLACSGEKSDRGAASNAALTPVAADAAVAPTPTPTPTPTPPSTPPDADVTAQPSFDPATEFHLDEPPATRQGARIAARDRKPGQLLLRSTPIGATAAVDGVRLGPTPVLWEGPLDGQTHEFTFVMAGHALARYRFVPVTSGIVHGTLVKLTDDSDAGVPEIPPPPRRQDGL
ncbi:MAG TPA: hypothetical protein VM261_18550 [Kofleriaceae bacterium]|nr:hypothetical protein [Kofleriaceae bacterium]